MAREKKPFKPNYNFFIRINNGEPINFDDLTPERRTEIQTKLSDRFAASRGYYPVEENN